LFVPTEFWLFRGTENSQYSVPNHSAEEKNAQNFVRGRKIELLEFRSEPFCGRENNSEFCFVEQKLTKTFGI
jgi:hypothetical protein